MVHVKKKCFLIKKQKLSVQKEVIDVDYSFFFFIVVKANRC